MTTIATTTSTISTTATLIATASSATITTIAAAVTSITATVTTGIISPLQLPHGDGYNHCYSFTIYCSGKRGVQNILVVRCLHE